MSKYIYIQIMTRTHLSMNTFPGPVSKSYAFSGEFLGSMVMFAMPPIFCTALFNVACVATSESNAEKNGQPCRPRAISETRKLDIVVMPVLEAITDISDMSRWARLWFPSNSSGSGRCQMVWPWPAIQSTSSARLNPCCFANRLRPSATNCPNFGILADSSRINRRNTNLDIDYRDLFRRSLVIAYDIHDGFWGLSAQTEIWGGRFVYASVSRQKVSPLHEVSPSSVVLQDVLGSIGHDRYQGHPSKCP